MLSPLTANHGDRPMQITGQYGRNAHSDELKAFLGLSATAKLPAAGLPPRYIQGIKVWVMPLYPPTLPPGQHRRRAAHRVKAECPTCHQVLSAGRLHQHMCRRLHILGLPVR